MLLLINVQPPWSAEIINIKKFLLILMIFMGRQLGFAYSISVIELAWQSLNSSYYRPFVKLSLVGCIEIFV